MRRGPREMLAHCTKCRRGGRYPRLTRSRAVIRVGVPFRCQHCGAKGTLVDPVAQRRLLAALRPTPAARIASLLPEQPRILSLSGNPPAKRKRRNRTREGGL